MNITQYKSLRAHGGLRETRHHLTNTGLQRNLGAKVLQRLEPVRVQERLAHTGAIVVVVPLGEDRVTCGDHEGRVRRRRHRVNVHIRDIVLLNVFPFLFI